MDDTETRPVEGIVFDLDGTLVESEHLHTGAWEKLLGRFGRSLPGGDWADTLVGISDSNTRDRILDLFPELREAGDILEMKQKIYRDMVAEHAEEMPMPGVHTRLRQLNAAEIPMAVGTNGVLANCRAVLVATGMLHYFQTMVTFDQVKNGKPDPDIYLLAAKRLGCLPERCAVIEDSPTGIRAARAAGCLVLGIETTMRADRLTEAGPDLIFPDTAAALDWLEERLVRQNAAEPGRKGTI